MAVAKIDKRLKAILVRRGCVSSEDANSASDATKEGEKTLSDILIERSLITERDIIAAVAAEVRLPPIDVTRLQVDEEVLQALPKDLATYYKVLPISKLGDMLTLAVSNPFDILNLDDIRIVTGCEIRPVVSTERAISTAITRMYDRSQQMVDEILEKQVDPEMVEVKEQDDGPIDLSALSDEGSPIIKLTNLLIFSAIKSKASDIHIEPMDKHTRVRIRIDGVLHEVQKIPKKLHNAITSRIKVMTGMDIAERRIPQDGKFSLQVEGRKIDFRVSVLPLVGGEKTVMRILDSSNLMLSLEILGFTEAALKQVRMALDAAYGMIMVTGPTGSGKTTTLYSALKEVMSEEDNIVTVEEPVEYQLLGVNQVAVNEKQGLTFAGALRSILRQDPDTVMIGEMRDIETCSIAIKAALTGHLVLSTLHTNDAASTVTRLIDMGVEPFLVTSACLLISAQRLLRKLCGECKRPVKNLPKQSLLDMGFREEEVEKPDLQIFEPNEAGCGRCTKGYKGRFAILEALTFTDDVKKLVLQGKNDMEIKAEAVRAGMDTLRRCGILNVINGRTSAIEVLRMTMPDKVTRA